MSLGERSLKGAFPADSGKIATAEETGAIDKRSVTFGGKAVPTLRPCFDT
jgi:hypothetical protein